MTLPKREEMWLQPMSPYAESKIRGEELCKQYSKTHGLATTILRYFNVYGERSPISGQYAPVIGIFLRQKRDGEPLTIVGDGEQRRDFTHVSDVVQANILAATTDVSDEYYGQMYNVGNGVNYSINEIANAISENQVNIPPRIGEARITLANNEKIKQVFK